MIVLISLPLLLSAAFGLTAPTLARRLPPRLATWLLSAGGLLAAIASSASLALLAFLFLAQTPLLVAQGHWSDAVLRGQDPLNGPIGALACAAVVVLAVRFIRTAVRHAAALREAYRLAAALPTPHAELAVIDSAARQAFAVPGRPGRIVATTAMLRRLDAAQRRALLAHERAHLQHRHHLHHSAAALAGAINPLLVRLSVALQLSCERWADEDAAAICARATVAEALARAAGGSRPSGSAAILAAAANDLAARLRALDAPAPRLVAWRVTALTVLLVAIAGAVALAMHDVERLFEHAQLAYRLSRP